MSDYLGPVETVDVAAVNAGVHLTPQQTTALAMALVDIGADFNV